MPPINRAAPVVPRHKMRGQKGFTLMEILIALFVFTIISMILTSALRSVIDAHAGAEKNAARLRELQMVVLLMSRDIEQTVNRPVLNTSAKEDEVFSGTPQGCTFTRTGYANPEAAVARSSLQRTGYVWRDDALWRVSWDVLDLAPDSRPRSRRLLGGVTAVRFEYLDKDKRFHKGWPINGDDQPLPRAVRVVLTLKDWGQISQLYLVPAQRGNISQTGQNPGAPDAQQGKDKMSGGKEAAE